MFGWQRGLVLAALTAFLTAPFSAAALQASAALLLIGLVGVCAALSQSGWRSWLASSSVFVLAACLAMFGAPLLLVLSWLVHAAWDRLRQLYESWDEVGPEWLPGARVSYSVAFAGWLALRLL